MRPGPRRNWPVMLGVVLSTLACQSPSPSRPYAGALMPSDLQGAALGVSWSDLQRLRPGARHDDIGVIERTDSGEVAYWFWRPADPSSITREPCSGCVVGAVSAYYDQPVTSAVAYEARWQGLHRAWEQAGGPPSSELIGLVTNPTGGERTSTAVTVWEEPNVRLLLSRVTNPEADGEVAPLRIAVQDAALPLAAVLAIPEGAGRPR
jgi:hypothetical protein